MTTPATQALINAAEQFRAAIKDGNAGTPEMLEYFDGVFEEALAATAAEAQPVAWLWEHVLNENGLTFDRGLSFTKVEPTDNAFFDGTTSTRVTPLAPLASPPASPAVLRMAMEALTKAQHAMQTDMGIDEIDAALSAIKAELAAPSLPLTLSDARAAKRWAWDQVREQVGTEGWTVGEAATFYGFFGWGWDYRGQLAKQSVLAASAPLTLSDEQITKLWLQYDLGAHACPLEFARAVRAALPAMTPAAADVSKMVMLTDEETDALARESTEGWGGHGRDWYLIRSAIRSFAAKNGLEIERLDRAAAGETK